MKMASAPKRNESYQSLAMMTSKVFRTFKDCSVFQCNIMDFTFVSPKTPALACILR